MSKYLTKREIRSINSWETGLLLDLELDLDSNPPLRGEIKSKFKEIKELIVDHREYLDHLNNFKLEKEKIIKVLKNHTKKMRFKHIDCELKNGRVIEFSSEMEPTTKYSRSHNLDAFEDELIIIENEICALRFFNSKRTMCGIDAGSCDMFGTINY